MAVYTTDRIRKPPYFRLSPYTRGRGKRAAYVIGFDSEAERGKPFLFQFAHPGKCPLHNQDVDLLDIGTEQHAGLFALIDYLADHCTRKDVEYIVFGFNLQYEWTQFFHDIPYDLKVAGEFDITLKTGKLHTAQIRATNDKRYIATVELGATKRRVKIVDAMAGWFGAGHVSLNAASKVLGIGTKLPKPQEFSRKAARSPEFIAYAKQDAILTQRLGEHIIGLHETYDVPLCMSAPHFAARVFRRRFLQQEITMPDAPLEQLGLDAYHGGKNGYYHDKPVSLKDVWHYDIRSAYPEAMAQLPDIEKGIWEARDEYASGTHSIWKATVTTRPCKFGAIQCRAGHYQRDRSRCSDNCPDPLRPSATDARGTETTHNPSHVTIHATGYEIDAAIARGEITIVDATGWVFSGPAGGPLARYCHEFYALKRDAKNETEKAAAKLFLNSLYGKFFQKVPLGNVTGWDIDTLEIVTTDPTQDYDYEAGGLYHPPIASLITGYVRAKIHGLEHRYNSIMTSTDGFFAYEPPDMSMIGSELGMLSVEQGTLRIWRERLYVFWPHERRDSKGKRVRPTYALHGFRGKPSQLRHMPLTQGIRFEYSAMAMVTLKMSTRAFGKGSARKKYDPGEFVSLPFDVALPELPSGNTS